MATRTPAKSAVCDTAAVNAAEAAVDAAIRATLHGGRSPRAVVVPAPAGAGKSHLTVSAVEEARRKGLRVIVAIPTNEQAFGLVRAVATGHCAGHADRWVMFVPATDVELPATVRSLQGVREAKAKDANGHDLIVGTLSKLGDAFAGLPVAV